MEDTALLTKQIKTAQILLFIVAAVTLISAILLLPDAFEREKAGGPLLALALAAVYLALGIYAKKKPYTALRAGLGVILLIILVNLIINPSGIFGHWASRVLSILLLCLGLADGRDAERKMTGPPAKEQAKEQAPAPHTNA
ncbi:MAG TPA: hypothetical protein VKQ52_21620 [Puia sp.]|nr:hypothetical protein [Puia sp.]